MMIKSTFRKLFWARMIIGFSVFLSVLCFLIFTILYNLNNKTIPVIIGASIILIFIIYLSLDIFKLFSLTITESGIEKTLLLTKRKENIPFQTITSFKQETIKPRNTRGQIANTYNTYVLKFGNSKSLIISPDNFENYTEIIVGIKSNL